MPPADAEHDPRRSPALRRLSLVGRLGGRAGRALISRSAIDSGFSCGVVSTSGPTYSSRPSPSWL